MAQYATIRPEQILQARKRLQNLPEKKERKTRQEAAQLLENDFKKALKKGYTPEEIRSILKAENIIIPAYLIKQFLPENEDGSSRKTVQASKAKPAIKASQDEAAKSQSFIIPDTPDEEL